MHRVLFMDFNGVQSTRPGGLEECLEGYLTRWEKEYGITPLVDFNYGSRLEQIVQAIHEQTGHGAVILIDEYDKPMLDVLEDAPELLARNRETLKTFYSSFKRSDFYLRFVFLTGVTKFLQVSVFSGFNQPKDISMYEKYEDLCGITEIELYEKFAEPIHEMAQVLELSESVLKEQLKQ